MNTKVSPINHREFVEDVQTRLSGIRAVVDLLGFVSADDSVHSLSQETMSNLAVKLEADIEEVQRLFESTLKTEIGAGRHTVRSTLRH